MLRSVKYASCLAALATVMACNSTSFKGSDDHKAGTSPQPGTTTAPGTSATPGTVTSGGQNVTAKNLNLTCPAGGTGSATLQTAVQGAQNTTVTVTGQFCGLTPAGSPNGLNVMFIIDWSGSMETNDPDSAGTCGRLQAVQTIVQKLQSQFQQGDNVLIAVQPFGDTALQGIAPTALSQFSANLNDQVFCRDDGGDTNYDSAFRTATQTLQSLNNGYANAVYFITDGVPDTSGDSGDSGLGGLFSNQQSEAQQLQQAYALGLQSAQALRAVPNTVFYALILDDHTGQNNNVPGFTPPAPADYLAQIAGDPTHAKEVANASDLAASIAQFENPAAFTLQSTTAAGKLNTATLGTQTIQLASIQQVAGQQGVWQFTTQPFTLVGTVGQAVPNNITITVQGSDGKTYTATAEIDFTEISGS